MIALVLIGITVLFAILIALRSIFPLKVCALCGSVFLTWISLLVLGYLGYEIPMVFVGILMGGSVTGVVYLLEQKIPARYKLFKLPLYLTLISLAYFILEQTIVVEVAVVFLILWLLMALVYSYRNSKRLKKIGQKIIECCKNW